MKNHLRRIICSLLSALMLFACVVIPSSFNSSNSKISIVQSLEADAATSITYGRVIANDLNVRKGPGTKYNSIRKLDFDTPVYVYQTKNGWGKISSDKEEWVSLDYVRSVSWATYLVLKVQYLRRQEFNPAKKVRVIASVLNVRYKPSTEYGDKLSTLKRGNTVYVYKTRYGLDNRVWGSINSAGTKWICLVEDDADFVEFV